MGKFGVRINFYSGPKFTKLFPENRYNRAPVVNELIMTASNYLSLSRIAFIPFFGVFLYMPQDWTYPVSAILFSLAAITDWLDGYLARKWGEETEFGAFIDPVADKLIVVVAMVLLIAKYPSIGITLAGLLIICREIIITALREWMAGQGMRKVVAVSNIGKWKTGMQITAIIMLCLFKPTFEFAGLAYGLWGFYLAQFFLYLAAALTLWSMIIYIRAALKAMKPGLE